MNRLDPFDIFADMFDENEKKQIEKMKLEYSVKNEKSEKTKECKDTNYDLIEMLDDKPLEESDVDEIEVEKEDEPEINNPKTHRTTANNDVNVYNDYNMLKEILTNIIPINQVDTAVYNLLREYENFANIAEDSAYEIMKRVSVSENVANMLSLIPIISQHYFTSRWKHENLDLSESPVVGQYVVDLLTGKTDECLYILCLDTAQRLRKVALISVGTINEVHVQTRKIVEICITHKAVNVVMTHNHPSGTLEASHSDIIATRMVQNALGTLDIIVTDHLIVAGDKFYSMAEHGLLDM